MTQPGRHRASPTPERRGGGRVVVAAALAVAAVTTGVAFVLVRSNTSSPDAGGSSQPTNAPLSSAATAPDGPDGTTAAEQASVQTTRVTTVDGAVVTIDEESLVVNDIATVAKPSQVTPVGLELLTIRVLGQDGRSVPFTGPVDLGADGRLTVTARYRLPRCPDVLPPRWPSPTAFSGAERVYVRLDQPQHTASALCSDRPPRSQPEPGLQGVLVGRSPARVELSWSGAKALSVHGIGSASGVAAVPLSRTVLCGAGERCVALLGAATPASPARTTLQMSPADRCPVGTDSDRLVLLVARGTEPSRPVSVPVDGLDRAVCRP